MLWYRLKFRRQVPIGPYIADFFCPSARYVDCLTDVRRDAWIQSQGLRVIWFWSDDVTNHLEGVLQAIAIEANRAPGEIHEAATPPPDPLPQGEGEK